jgi:hypothetical protein
MRIDERAFRAALGIDGNRTVAFESAVGGDTLQVTVGGSDGGIEQRYLVRTGMDPHASMNDAAVLEALTNSGYRYIPRLAGFAEGIAIEVEFEGIPLVSLRAEPAIMDQAIHALAELHQIDIREGLDWEEQPKELIPGSDVPLHRLGFAAHERGPAAKALGEAREALLRTRFGFSHRALTASKVLAGRDRVVFVDFSAAGQGAQVFDLASLLATAGLEAEQRRASADLYARLMGLEQDGLADLADLATIVWGIEYELALPRRQVAALGDDAAMERMVLESTRIRATFTSPAGNHPSANAIRAALWPG